MTTPSQLNTDQHGFTWNTKDSTGVFIPMEVGYATTFSEDRYPKKYDVGGYYDAASYTRPDGLVDAQSQRGLCAGRADRVAAKPSHQPEHDSVRRCPGL